MNWRLQALTLLLTAWCSWASSPSFENTAISRSVELGGTLVHVSTTYSIKSLQDRAHTYTIALSPQEFEKTSWLEVKTKASGTTQVLEVQGRGQDPDSGLYLLDVKLPRPLKVDATLNLVLETVQTRATWAWPPAAAQGDQQSLKYQADLFVPSPYNTQTYKNRIKASSPNILSYTTPKRLEPFISDSPVSKSAATLTYGPYNNLPPSADGEFLDKYQQRIIIHYTHDYPVLEVTELRRSAEISHWGANLNIQDDIHLRNAGPTLKGHFSRLDHQMQSFYNKRIASHVLPGLTLHLPSGIRNTYYYDLIGNVSTSKLRTSPSPPPRSKAPHPQLSVLELKPRYPLMGGWNYSFTLGWDAPLHDSVKWDKGVGKYFAEIPIMTEVPTAVVLRAELKVILPEGATDVHFVEPFPAITTELTKTTTYLDTIGRPTLVFTYEDLTDKHVRSIYVSYRVPSSAHYRKPLAVSAVLFGLFMLAFAIRRIDLTIQKQKKA